jgi:hypothetical protein
MESTSSHPRWRLITFRVLAVLAALFFLTNIQAAVSPWGPVMNLGESDFLHPGLHRWSDGLAGGPDLMVALLFLAMAWRPVYAPLFLQWFVVAMIVFFAANGPFAGPGIVIVSVPILLVLIAFPWPRALLMSPWRDGVQWPTLVLTVLAAALIVPDAWHALSQQIQGTSELARNNDLASNAEHDINLLLVGLAASMLRPGRQVLGTLVGLVYAYLGIAAISIPNNPGSWGVVGGGLAIAAGCVYVVLAHFYPVPETTGAPSRTVPDAAR